MLLLQLIVYTDVDLLCGDEDLVEELSPALTQGVTDGAGKILFFTSGTTERAKAVVLTDHSLCQSAYNGSAKLPLSRRTRCCACCRWGMCSALCAGCSGA